MTGRLPNPELAVIDQAKITAYLFASSHPAGSAKAAFFSRFGFDPTAWQVLRDALIDHARHARVIAVGDSEFGTKYTLGRPAICAGRPGASNSRYLVHQNGREDASLRDGLLRAWSSPMIKEMDPVVLTEGLPEYGLQIGDVGWVVMVHDKGAGYEVEFVTLSGDTISVVTIASSAVRPVRKREIAHARLVA
jgi:Domain of unknown function (DUF4926)